MAIACNTKLFLSTICYLGLGMDMNRGRVYQNGQQLC